MRIPSWSLCIFFRWGWDPLPHNIPIYVFLFFLGGILMHNSFRPWCWDQNRYFWHPLHFIQCADFWSCSPAAVCIRSRGVPCPTFFFPFFGSVFSCYVLFFLLYAGATLVRNSCAPLQNTFGRALVGRFSEALLERIHYSPHLQLSDRLTANSQLTYSSPTLCTDLQLTKLVQPVMK